MLYRMPKLIVIKHIKYVEFVDPIGIFIKHGLVKKMLHIAVLIAKNAVLIGFSQTFTQVLKKAHKLTPIQI